MKYSEYCIHDNGARPFLVTFDDKTIIVKEIYGENNCKWKPILKFKDYKKIFVGKDIRFNNADNNYPFDGNTILINLVDNKYIYIGYEIYEFEINDTIVDYISPLYGSDVAYPFAIGTTYTYLLSEKKYVSNDIVKTKQDPYVDYYNHNKLNLTEYFTPLKYKIIVNRKF
jgi:hypothetical protein